MISAQSRVFGAIDDVIVLARLRCLLTRRFVGGDPSLRTFGLSDSCRFSNTSMSRNSRVFITRGSGETVGAKGVAQEELGRLPVPLDGRYGDSDDIGRFFDRQTAEEPELDDPRLALIQAG